MISDCKFCGCESVMVMADSTLSSRTLYYVQCLDCEARGPIESTEDDAVEMWNRVWD